MASVVEFEEKITSANQNDPSAGRITVFKSSCPDLAAATLTPPGYIDKGDSVERLLPVGSKLQFLIDRATQEQTDILYVLPSGKAWSSTKCRGSASGSKGFLGSWFAVAGLAVLVTYLLTRKK